MTRTVSAYAPPRLTFFPMLMKSRILGCLGTVLALVFILSVALNVFFLLFHGDEEDSREMKKLSEQVVQPATGKGKAKIARIDIEGLISNDSPAGDVAGGTMVESTKRALRQAVEDADVKAIVDANGNTTDCTVTAIHPQNTTTGYYVGHDNNTSFNGY